MHGPADDRGVDVAHHFPVHLNAGDMHVIQSTWAGVLSKRGWGGRGELRLNAFESHVLTLGLSKLCGLVGDVGAWVRGKVNLNHVY
jgi:hypothetical protein